MEAVNKPRKTVNKNMSLNCSVYGKRYEVQYRGMGCQYRGMGPIQRYEVPIQRHEMPRLGYGAKFPTRQPNLIYFA